MKTIDELQDAYVTAGAMCNWEQTDVITAALASGTCRETLGACDNTSDWSVLSVYTSEAARDEIVNNIRSGSCPVSLLVGPNWIINANDAPDMQGQLGGDAYTS